MININKTLDFAIFTLDKEVKIGDVILKTGLNQLLREENEYRFRISNGLFYASIPVSENITILKAIYSESLFYGKD